MVTAYGQNPITAEAHALRDMYRQRDAYFNSIRALLELEPQKVDDDLDIEIFTANDPRTLWNMGVFLLQPRPLVNVVTDVDGRELVGDTRAAAEVVEQFLNRQWRDLNEQYMRRGRGGAVLGDCWNTDGVRLVFCPLWD